MLAGSVRMNSGGTIARERALRFSQGNGNRIRKAALHGEPVERLVAVGFRTDHTAVFIV